MENNFSAIKSIQELKNLLDSGAITQQEYEVLKQKIIFGNNSTATSTSLPHVSPVNPVRTETPNPIVPPTPIQERIYPRAVEGTSIGVEHKNLTNVDQKVTAEKSATENSNKNFRSLTFNEPEQVTEGKRKDWLLTILISLAAILLIGLVAYQLLDDSESERLTSKSGPDNEEVITERAEEPVVATAAPKPTATEDAPSPQPENAAPTTDVPAEAPTPAAGTTSAPASETPVTTETTTPAPTPVSAPKLSSEEALNKIKDQLQAYYTDMKSAPFAAQNHFAPTVERYYTLIGTTPQAINENINSYHFNEFQDSQSSIEDGSLKMTSSGGDGYEVTYIEHGSAFRKSKGQKQETTARVRAKFDQNFKMTYFRQEQLLENRFLDQ